MRGRDAHPSDEALVAAFVAGDRDALTALVDRYHRRVYGICHRYFGDPDDAEEAAQEAFVTLVRKAGTFAGTARFSTWMYRVATNTCHDLARRRARRPRTVPIDGPAHPVAELPDADDVLARRELGVELERALAVLEPDLREAIVLHDVAGLGYAELAAHFGVAVGTMKSRVHRGHARLATTLAHLRATGPDTDAGLGVAAPSTPSPPAGGGPAAGLQGNPGPAPTVQSDGGPPRGPGRGAGANRRRQAHDDD